MAFTRPVVGADISAADFGQPVYDGIVRSGFFRSATAANSGTANNVTQLAIASVRAQANNAWTANGANSAFTCVVPGVCTMVGIIAAAGTPFPSGMFVGIQMGGLIVSRMLSSYAAAGNGYTFETLSASWVGQCNAGDVLALVAFASGGSWTLQPNTAGTINDPPAPSLSCWRVSL